MTRNYDECQALYRAARSEERSSKADRSAVRLALAATLAAGVHTAAAGTAVAAVAKVGIGNGAASVAFVGAKGLVQLLVGGNFLTGLLVGAVVGTAVSATAFVVAPPNQSRSAVAFTRKAEPVALANSRSGPTDLPRETVRQKTTPDTTSGISLQVASGLAVERTPTAAPNSVLVNASTVSQPVRQDRLLDETQALAKVQEALSRNEPDYAWTLLQEQEKQFSSGQLAEERAAAKVLSLCAAGRVIEANQARSVFIATHPQSPLTNRVKKGCGH